MASSLFDRDRVRPRKAASESASTDCESIGNDADGTESSSQSEQDRRDPTDSDGDVNDTDESSSDNDQPPEEAATSISFGALAKAQESLRKRKRSLDDDETEDDLQTPLKSPKTTTDLFESEAQERKAGKKDTRDFTRTSKHAPAELSSKKAVSRKRAVVPSHKVAYRDPRFDRLSGPFDAEKAKKNYAFLSTYRDSEIADLKASIRKTKDVEAKEKLKRALLSMESRKKSELMKEQQQEVLRKHRREEKEKVEKGKKPFYLKKGELKKATLVERFKGMKGKEVEKVVERRRKKQAGREKKGMPEARRG